MRRTSRRWLGFMSAATLLLPLLAYAQPDTQKGDADFLPLPKNITELLDSRRDKSKMPVNEDMLKKIAKGLPDGIDKKMIQNFLNNNSELRNPKYLESLLDHVKQHLNDRPSPGLDYKNLDKVLKQVQELSKNLSPDPQRVFNPNDPERHAPMNPSTPDDAPADSMQRRDSKKDDRAEMIAQMLVRNFGDSPAFRDVAKDFANLLSQEQKNGDMPRFLDDIQNEWKSLMRSKNNDSPSSNWVDMFSNVKLPELNSSGSRISEHANSEGPSRSSGFSSGGSSDFNGWSEVFLIIALVGCSLLCWYFYLRTKPAKLDSERFAAEVVPIDPLTIATREDVVKAFDAVSLAKCGAEAINWHHRQIADDLGVKEPINRDAVNRLATLYEKARYAPTHELFTEIEVAEARARICQIAGVPTV